MSERWRNCSRTRPTMLPTAPSATPGPLSKEVRPSLLLLLCLIRLIFWCVVARNPKDLIKFVRGNGESFPDAELLRKVKASLAALLAGLETID